MKAMSIKRKIVLSVLCCFTLLFSSLGFLSFRNVKGYAAESFTMVEGASVYLYKDAEETTPVSGIRFAAKVPESLKGEQFKVLILHKEMLAKNDKMTGNKADIDVNGDVVAQLMTNYEISEADFVNKFTVVDRPAVQKTQAEGWEDGYYAYGAMSRLPDSVFTNDFVGFIYYVSEGSRVYATLPASGISGVTRNIAQVANKALSNDFEGYYNDGYTDTLLTLADSYGDETVAYGSANTAIREFSTVYTTKTQIEVVPYTDKAYAGEVITVSDKTIGEKTYQVTTEVAQAIESPVDGQNDYLVKNTVLPTEEGIASGAMPFWFDSSDARYALPDSLRTQLKTLLDSGKDATLGFYFYNAFGTKVHVLSKTDKVVGPVSNTGTVIKTVPANSDWILIEAPIGEVTLGETAEQDSYQFGVFLEGESNTTKPPVYLDVVDGENTISSKQIFYTDEISFMEIPNGASQNLLDSYGNGKLTKSITKDPQYLHNGSNYALFFQSVEQTGTYDKLGTIYSTTGCSLTNWSNVVLTADIYNASESVLSIGLKFVEALNGGMWTNDGAIPAVSCNSEISLPAKGWTKVTWSLKTFGIVSDVFADGRGIELIVKNGATYDLAITNLDIADGINGASQTLLSSYGTSTLKKEMTTEAKYLHNGSKYALKFDDANSTKYDTLGTITSAEDCSLTDWSDVVLTADIYNGGEAAVEIGLKILDETGAFWTNGGLLAESSCGQRKTLAVGGWTTVSWSLKDLGLTFDMFAAGYSISLTIPDVASYSVVIANLDFVNNN